MARGIKNIIDTKKIINNCITTYNSLYLNIYLVINKSFSRVTKIGRFYFKQCIFLLLDQYISNISNLYNLDKNTSLVSQTICDHMCSDPESDHIFINFDYVPGLYFVSSCMWQLSTYFEDGEVLEFTVSWYLIKLNLPHSEYYFLPNTEPNSKYYLEKYFKNRIY